MHSSSTSSLSAAVRQASFSEHSAITSSEPSSEDDDAGSASDSGSGGVPPFLQRSLTAPHRVAAPPRAGSFNNAISAQRPMPPIPSRRGSSSSGASPITSPVVPHNGPPVTPPPSVPLGVAAVGSDGAANVSNLSSRPPPPRTSGPPPNLSPRASPPRRLLPPVSPPVAAPGTMPTTAAPTTLRGPPPLLAVRKLGDPIVGVFPNSGARRSFSAAPSGDGEDGVGQGATTIESESSLAGVASPSLVARGRPPIERRDRVLSNAALRGVRTSTVAGGLATMRGPIAASDEHHIGERNEEVRDRFASTSAMLESLNLSGRLPNTRPPPPPPSSGGPPGPPPPAPPQHPASAPVSAQSSSTALNSSGNTENSFGFLSSLSGMLKQRKPPEEADARIRELMHIESASGVAPSSPRGARPELDEDSLQWCTPRSVVNAWVDLPEDPLVVVKDATDHIETPRAGVDIHGAALEFQDEQKRPYRDYLYDKDHMHYLPAKDADALGPIIVSLECGKKPTSAFQRGILRTKKGDVRFVVPASTSSKDRLKHLRTVVPDLAQLKLIDIKEPPLNDALLKYEDQCVARQYKFGAIMWRAGQSEDQLFANNEMPGGFELFLTMLGERIELSGWSGFRGGLDVTGGTTGTQSVFRHFVHSDEDVEIMYHVAPLLPFFEKDLQQLERKRHVGNDVVNVVFVEGDEPFPTSLITSHFTYVFIVVRLESMSPARFRVAVCAKDGVRPFGPPLPDPPVFDCNQTFSDWISAKLVNAERASMYAQTFATKMARTKTALLGALVSEYRGRK